MFDLWFFWKLIWGLIKFPCKFDLVVNCFFDLGLGILKWIYTFRFCLGSGICCF
ncbi:hypothetical protein RchiOBHm_Chr7g0204771 [Rosa chinensis]|uniref:Uncharacterized protein n=1 Tax=Rosa chinensis TaxID=74649 RepID=A0A2P6P8T1_ROSCH|nr:hypothetical protein RchiOBHm_Chr7g0204771 [Rosa chinensis]